MRTRPLSIGNDGSCIFFSTYAMCLNDGSGDGSGGVPWYVLANTNTRISLVSRWRDARLLIRNAQLEQVCEWAFERLQLEQVFFHSPQSGDPPPPPPLPLSQVNDFEAIGRIRRRMNKFKPLSGGSGISCKRFYCMRKQLYAVLLHNEL